MEFEVAVSSARCATPQHSAPAKPVTEIARKLVIPSGKNRGEHPSIATVYRILGETSPSATTAR